MVVDDLNRSVLPEQKIWKVDATQSPGQSIGTGLTAYNPVVTKKFFHQWVEGEPGDYIDWHTHMPSMWIVSVVIDGRYRWRYMDADGEERAVEAGPGEVLCMPGGLENRVEIIGDEPHRHFSTIRYPPVTRLEQLLDQENANYDPRDVPAGLRFDEDRGVALETDSAAVLE